MLLHINGSAKILTEAPLDSIIYLLFPDFADPNTAYMLTLDNSYERLKLFIYRLANANVFWALQALTIFISAETSKRKREELE